MRSYQGNNAVIVRTFLLHQARFDNEEWRSKGENNRDITKGSLGPYTLVTCDIRVEGATETESVSTRTPCTGISSFCTF